LSRSTRALRLPKGLDVTLVREVSWSNVRDKLNIGRFDAAHLLAPVAIASSSDSVRQGPIVAPFNLGLNGNAIHLVAGIARGDHGRNRRQLPQTRCVTALRCPASSPTPR